MHATTTLIAKDVLRDEMQHRAAARSTPISWWRGLVYGLLSGVAMGVLESFVLPASDLAGVSGSPSR